MENEKKSSASQARLANDLMTMSEGKAVSEAMTSARRDLSDHLHIGMLFSNLMDKAIAHYTAEHGDTEQTRMRAKEAVYSCLEREHGRSRASVRLHIRCYQHFGASTEKGTLTLRDMALRLGHSKPASTL